MRLRVRFRKSEVGATILMCLLGFAVALQVSASSVARLSSIGGGWMSVLAGSALMAFGIFWLFDSRLSPDEDDDVDIGSSKWRGVCGFASGLFAFIVLYKYGGLLAATFTLIFITVLGDSRHSWRTAGTLAACITLIVAILHAWVPFEIPLPMVSWG